MRRRTAVLGTFMLVALATSGMTGNSAYAANANKVIDDCASSPSGLLRHSYSRADLRDALRHMPADVIEYTGCADAIQSALHERSDVDPRENVGGDGDNPSYSAGGADQGTGSGAVPGRAPEPTGPAAAPEGGSARPSQTSDAETSANTAGPQSGSAEPVGLASSTVVPGLSANDRSLPISLVVFLSLLAVGAAGMGIAVGSRLLRSHRRH